MNASTAAIAEAVEALLDTTRETHSTAEETFTVCRVCQECDSHTDACFVPALEQWLTAPDA